MSKLVTWGMFGLILYGVVELMNLKSASNYMNASTIAEGMAQATRFKFMISQHYMITGEFAGSNEAMGLPEPESFANRAIKSISVQPSGSIKIIYTEASGMVNGSVLFVPEINRSTSELKWKCVSYSYRGIHNVNPDCKYLGQPAG